MTDETNDPTLLKIRGDRGFANDGEKLEYLNKITAAMLIVQSKHGYATLKMVGASSISNGAKAAANARGEAAKKGLDLVIEPYFGEASFGDEQRSAMIFKLVPRDKK